MTERSQPTPQTLPLLWWDVAVGFVLLLFAPIGVINVFGEHGDAAPVALTLSPLVTIAILYLALGRPALRRCATPIPPTRADLVFLGLVVVNAGVAALIEPSYATLQSVFYPMIWVILPTPRRSIIWSGALALAVGIGSAFAYARLGGDQAIGMAALVAVLSFGFSVAMGTWITRIHAASERYRALADELQRSQERAASLAEAAGASAERERLSRELHDTLTQTLAGLVMLSEQAGRALDVGDEARARDRVQRVGSAARDAVSEARALVATMQPLGEGGLEQALARITARFASDTGIVVDTRIEAQAIDRERQVVLLRAAQEGLANARRHARADRVELALLGNERDVLLRVDDNGRGPAVSRAESPAGFGLSGLGDRVRAVGGSVEFGPRPGGGARLEVRMPREIAADVLADGWPGERGVAGARGDVGPDQATDQGTRAEAGREDGA